jgi:REP element-mobilizing transposase RayT
MPGPIKARQGANLPHWTAEGATYFITFRLADSLPKPAVERLKSEQRMLERQFEQGTQQMTAEELIRRSKLKSEAYLKMLDECHGECLLRRPAVAEVVASALKFFDKQRYRLHAWCIMPNHVHAVVQPVPERDLPGILHSWKSFTSTKINKLLGRQGAFWQTEYYDHLIRDDAEFAHYVKYTRDNPMVAGLVDWPWVG